ncbi:hypothetical protein R3P38DRAFT_2803586 [Favolaschia claudopus]|uniref:Uncharacterized protein n=1 Tax=Favolaschia claudopus TaxID=2862362 RepID=A0AAV9ZSL7_9AGAR
MFTLFWMGHYRVENCIFTEAYLHYILEHFDLPRVPFIFHGAMHWDQVLAGGLQSLGVKASKICLPPSSSLSPEMRDAYEIICKSSFRLILRSTRRIICVPIRLPLNSNKLATAGRNHSGGPKTISFGAPETPPKSKCFGKGLVRWRWQRSQEGKGGLVKRQMRIERGGRKRGRVGKPECTGEYVFGTFGHALMPKRNEALKGGIHRRAASWRVESGQQLRQSVQSMYNDNVLIVLCETNGGGVVQHADAEATSLQVSADKSVQSHGPTYRHRLLSPDSDSEFPGFLPRRRSLQACLSCSQQVASTHASPLNLPISLRMIRRTASRVSGHGPSSNLHLPVFQLIQDSALKPNQVITSKHRYGSFNSALIFNLTLDKINRLGLDLLVFLLHPIHGRSIPTPTAAIRPTSSRRTTLGALLRPSRLDPRLGPQLILLDRTLPSISISAERRNSDEERTNGMIHLAPRLASRAFVFRVRRNCGEAGGAALEGSSTLVVRFRCGMVEVDGGMNK